MSNISFEFANPLFLLVLVVAIPLALIPYFRTKKAKRRNRNKITSLVLHLIIVVLCTLVLSGFTIKQEDSLQKKETFIVVDVSRSIDNQADKIDEFVADILKDIDGNNKVGIVTFSDDATVASPLSSNVSAALSALQNARRHGADKATDINEALTFTAKQFTNKNNAKIVIITDGIDTENNLIIYSDNAGDYYEYTNNEIVLQTVKSLARQGISIDTVYFEPVRYDKDMQINSVLFRKSVLPLEPIDITVSVQSHVNAKATLSLYDRVDNGKYELKDTISYDVKMGDNPSIKFTDFKFEVAGLHTIKVELSGYGGDQIEENNVYYSYVNIETNKSILIVDGDGKQANAGMFSLLTEMGYKATVVSPDKVPQRAADLTVYNEVILMNVNVSDLPNGYDRELDTYVGTYGGGLFTTGGNQTYYYGGMDGTRFDTFLPVNVIPEENSVNGIMFVVDASGSMFFDFYETRTGGSTPKYPRGNSKYPDTKMYQVEQALTSAAMTIFNKKDYIGLMHFGKKGISTDLPLSPASQRGSFISALNRISEIEGTQWYAPLVQAAEHLRDTAYDIDKKQIIFITDGDPRELGTVNGINEQTYNFAQLTQSFLDNYGVTTSVIGIDGAGTMNAAMLDNMTTAVDKNGKKRFYQTNSIESLLQAISDECKAASTDTMNESGPYDVSVTEAASKDSAIFADVIARGGAMPKVQQYNGFTVKNDKNVEALLSADNVENGTDDAIFARWTYGKGHVASFASDLSDWAKSYYTDSTAKLFLKNAIMAILPEDSIKSTLAVEYERKNHTTDIYVLGDLTNGQAVFIEVTDPDGKVTSYDNALRAISDDECMISLHNEKPGIYKIYLEKEDANGNIIDTANFYFTFSYSQEYNTFFGDDEALLEFLSQVSVVGKGHMLSLSDFEYNHSLDYVTVVYDPKMIFAIIAAVLFILDIIARKFNFKWPHEWFRKKQVE